MARKKVSIIDTLASKELTLNVEAESSKVRADNYRAAAVNEDEAAVTQTLQAKAISEALAILTKANVSI